MKKLIILAILIFNLLGCEKPAPKGKSTDEIEVDAAVTDFIITHYKDWKLKGFSDESIACRIMASIEPCNIDLNLANGDEDKIIHITVRQFTNPDGEPYYLTYEIDRIDLINQKVNKINGHFGE